MARPTDAADLLLRIDATTEGLRRELKKAENQTGKSTTRMDRLVKNLDRRFQQIRGTVTRMAKVAATAFAGVATALAGMTAAGLKSVDSLAKVSARLGIATDDLAKLRFAAEQTGVASNTLDMALQRMTRRVAEAAQGSGAAVSALEELGISAQELVALSPDQMFRRVTDAMEGVGNQADKVRLAMKLFDSEGVSLVQTMAAGTAGLDEFGRQAEQAGIAISGIDASKVEAANDAMNSLRTIMTGLTQQLAVKFAPVIQAVAERIFNVGTESGATAEIATRSFDFMVRAAGKMADAIKGIQVGWLLMKAGFQAAARFISEQFQRLSNFLVDVWNSIPFFDEMQYARGISGFTETMERELAATRAEIDDIMSQPLPSVAIEQFVRDAERSFEGLGDVVVATMVDSRTLAEVQQDVADALAATADAANDASDAINKVSDSTQEATFAMQAQERMLENLQRAWGEAFYRMDLTARGFFGSVGDGFRRMLSEMAAADLMKATFGGGGMSAIAGGSLAGLATSAGGFLSGVTGSATGVAAGTVGPPTAAAASGAKFAGALTSPMGIAALTAGGVAIAAKLLDSGGTPSGNAGMLLGQGLAPGISQNRRFSVDPFASGFSPEGFARRADQSEAIKMIDQFREVDAGLTEMVRALGGTIDLTQATLGGLDERGQGRGVFMGSANHDGTVTSLPIAEQINMFVSQLVDHVGGLDEALIDSMRSAGSVEEVFHHLNEAMEESERSAEELAASMERAAWQRASLERQLLELQGDTEGLRQMELAALEDSNHELQQRIWSLQDEQQAVREARAALEQMRDERLSQIEAERDSVREGMAVARDAVDAAWDNMQRTMSDRADAIRQQSDLAIQRVEDEREQVAAVYAETAQRIRASIRAVSDSVGDLQRRARILGSAAGRFSLDDAGSRAASRGRAMQTLAGAGSSTPIDQIRDAIGVLSGSTAGLFDSLAEQQFEQARAGNLIADLRDETESQLSIEERTLKNLEDRAARQEMFEQEAITRFEEQIESIERSRDAQIAGINEQLRIAQDQMDALNGVQHNVVTLSDLTAQIATYEQEAELAQRQLDALDRQEDAVRMSASRQIAKLEEIAGSSRTQTAISAVIMRSNNEIVNTISSLQSSIVRLASDSDDGQSFSGGGIATGPESGYQATLHGTEAVIPIDNGFVPVRVSGSGLGASGEDIGQMRAQLEAMNRELAQIRNNTGDSASYQRRAQRVGIKIQEDAA